MEMPNSVEKYVDYTGSGSHYEPSLTKADSLVSRSNHYQIPPKSNWSSLPHSQESASQIFDRMQQPTGCLVTSNTIDSGSDQSSMAANFANWYSLLNPAYRGAFSSTLFADCMQHNVVNSVPNTGSSRPQTEPASGCEQRWNSANAVHHQGLKNRLDDAQTAAVRGTRFSEDSFASPFVGHLPKEVSPFLLPNTVYLDQQLAQHQFAYETPAWRALDRASATGYGPTMPLPLSSIVDGLSLGSRALIADHPLKFFVGCKDDVDCEISFAERNWMAQQTGNDVKRADCAVNALPETRRAPHSRLRNMASNHAASSSTSKTATQYDYPSFRSSSSSADCFDYVTPPPTIDRGAFQPIRFTGLVSDNRKLVEEHLLPTALSLSPRSVVASLPLLQLPEAVEISTASPSPKSTTACDANLHQPVLARRLVMDSTTPPRHVCPDCGAEFTHRHSVRRHQRVHNGQRPFRCPVCNVTFTQSGNLQRHIRNKHRR